MRLFIIALLAAISYAQTVDNKKTDNELTLQKLKGFAASLEKINVNPPGYTKLEEEMQSGNFFKDGPIPAADLEEAAAEKAANAKVPSHTYEKKSTLSKEGAVNSRISSLASETKASLGDPLVPNESAKSSALNVLPSLVTEKEEKKEAPAAAVKPVSEKIELSATNPKADDDKVPALEDLLTPSVKGSAKAAILPENDAGNVPAPVSAIELSSYTHKDTIIAISLFFNVTFLFLWLNSCTQSKNYTYEATLLEEI